MNINLLKKVLVVFCLVFFISTSICFNYSFAAENENKQHNKKVLIVSPHEDDETIACAGVIRKTIEEGNDVRVMFITNGDYDDIAKKRAVEIVNAMAKLGLDKNKIYYLGYSDWSVLNDLYWRKDDPSSVKVSDNGYSETYGFTDILTDYHYLMTGSHATYNRQNVLSDIQNIISTFNPDNIYMPSAFEMHPDHKAASFFTTEAILNAKKNDEKYSPTIHEYLIYKKGLPQDGIDYYSKPVPFTNDNAHMDQTSPYTWVGRESIPLFNEMNCVQTYNRLINLKSEGAKIEVNSAIDTNSDINKAFDGDISTNYISDSTNNNIEITITLSKPEMISKIRTSIGLPCDIAPVEWSFYDCNYYEGNVVNYNGILYKCTQDHISKIKLAPDNALDYWVPYSDEAAPTKTIYSIEAANDIKDMDKKSKNYSLLVDNMECYGDIWQETRTSNAYNYTVWKFTIHTVGTDKNVHVPEIEFYNANLKSQALKEYVSQAMGGYERFVMADEIFWKKEISSLSYSADITASSEKAYDSQGCKNVTDGVVLGDGIFKVRYDDLYGQDPTRDIDNFQNWYNKMFEWSTEGETSNAWIQLNWRKDIQAGKIILYDRPDLDENILKAKLTFSDGSTLDVGPLNKNGSATEIKFDRKKFNWVRLSIEQVEGINAGLAEFEVYDEDK